ncbi:MAG: ATP-dependent Clp protease adapter ClpS [Mariprofundaceae bacterium]
MGKIDTVIKPITVKQEQDAEVVQPPLYQVVLLNDDFTPMDFVVEVLCRFFSKNMDEATQIMLNIHHKNAGICGLYPRDIAESKVAQTQQFSRDHEHPLQCIMESSHAKS